MPIWLNGALMDEADVGISPMDRGLLFGDGVFETIRCYGDRLLWIDDHLARLRAGAHTLEIPVEISDRAIVDGLETLLRALALDEAALRLTVTRGRSEARGLWPAFVKTGMTTIATVAPLARRTDVRLIVAEGTRRNEHSPLSRIKSLNYGDNLLARQEAERRRADDAILLNGAGRVACCTVGNLFLYFDDHWWTPPISDGAMPGLARARLIVDLGAHERMISAGELVRVSAAIVTNSLAALAVIALGGVVLPPLSEKISLGAIYK